MRPTVRELGIRLGTLLPGPTNSVADVTGWRVGHVTLVRGHGALSPGGGPVRTGVTVVVPPGEGPWPAACHVINGYGKTLGLMQVAELGTLEAPVFLTNTHSVGAVQQGYLRHLRDAGAFDPRRSVNVVVAECNDGYLNDLWGLHVTAAEASAALEDAGRAAAVTQGTVGAGTGMTAFGHKGGIGTASRVLPGGATLAAMVLANCGRPEQLILGGRRVVPDGRPAPAERPPAGSIIVLLITDAPADAWALRRVAVRATHGLARTGAISEGGSGDVVLAVAAPGSGGPAGPTPVMDDLFLAAVESTEEAIWNALATAETVIGRDGHRSEALPAAWIRAAAG